MTDLEFLEFIKNRLLCKHEYEFRSKATGFEKGKLVKYETYQCIKCGRRKENCCREDIS